jgi:hypothetical protein
MGGIFSRSPTKLKGRRVTLTPAKLKLGGCGGRSGFFMLRPKPEQRGIAADEQIRQNDFHGHVGGLRRDVQRIREMAQTTTWLVMANPYQTETINHKTRCKPHCKTSLQANPSAEKINRCKDKFKNADNPKQLAKRNGQQGIGILKELGVAAGANALGCARGHQQCPSRAYIKRTSIFGRLMKNGN